MMPDTSSALAAYLFVMLTTLARIPGETAWPWASAIAKTCTGPAARCVLFTAQAIAEGGFWEPVLSGKCNDPTWRAKQRGSWAEDSCDQGAAAGPWQIHAKDAGAGVTPALLRDPAQGTRIAWEYWTRAPGAWSTWRRARGIAGAYSAQHPPPP